MKHLKIIFFVFLLLLLSNFTFAQTAVNGFVRDKNKKPIVAANVIFLDANQGTLTNSKGFFSLESTKKITSIRISIVGYEVKTIAINADKTNFIEVVLKESSTNLGEVVIVSKKKIHLKKQENPAYKILKGIWANKRKNWLKASKAYEYEKYAIVEMGMTNMDSVFLKKALKKNYDSIVSKIKMNVGNKFLIPIQLTQKVEKIYGNNLLHKERIDVAATKNYGVAQKGRLLENISRTFKEIDVYENNITILNKNFVSPISTQGFGTYDYDLIDSTFAAGKKYYTIRFSPRESRDLSFRGDFTVDAKTFALTEINMQTPRKVNLNFVKNFDLKKTFVSLNDSVYLPLANEYKGDFSLLTKNEKEKGLYVFKKETFGQYKLNEPKEDLFYSISNPQITANQFDKPQEYWDKLEDSETKNTYETVSLVKESKKINGIMNAIYIISDGFIPVTKYIQTGNIWATLSKNEIEGLRLRLGLRTFNSDNDLLRFSGFIAYGNKDKFFKFGIEARYLLTKMPRSILSIAHLNDNQQMGITQFNGTYLLDEAEKSAKAFFVRGDNFFISHIKKSMFRYDIEVKKNLHLGITFAHNNITSASPSRFILNYIDTETAKIRSETTDVTTDLYLTYSPNKQVSGFGVDQRVGSEWFRTFMFNYKRGYKDILGGDFKYNRIQALYRYPVQLGKFGVFDATLSAGKTFEPIPLSILTAVSSNQTYFLLSNTFALLDYYDFVTNTYVEGHFEHHLNGLLLNRIPLVKKLNWRSLLTFRTVYGTISKENVAINQSSINYTAPNKLYYEYGFGFENIGVGNIRPLRIDFIWRSDFQNLNGPVSPKFGIRFGSRVNF